MADVVNKPLDPYTSECLVVGNGSDACGFTTGNLWYVATGLHCRVAYMGCETTSVRFHIAESHSAPAANSGMLFAAGDYLLLDSPTAIDNFQVICTGGTATLYITFYA